MQALEAIEDALKTGSSGSKLAELTSRFYTIIPHDFGRRVPPTIRDHETLQKKFDMLLVGRCCMQCVAVVVAHSVSTITCHVHCVSARCWGTLR